MGENESPISIVKIQDREEIFQVLLRASHVLVSEKKKWGYRTIYFSAGLQAFLAEGILKIELK